MKRLILTAGLMFALLAPASAFASYVCETGYFPSPGRVRTTLTTDPNCVGTTTTLWFCEATNTSSLCASGLRYQVSELTNLHSQLARAADSQQVVFHGTTTCSNGAAGCGYYILFRP
jgi:hypothetical protein